MLAGCTRDRDVPSGIARLACASRPGASRWAGGAAYREAASYGRDEARYLNEVGGVAVRDSLVFIYDAPEARVLVLDPRLRLIRAIGRKGHGPGELESYMDLRRHGTSWRWIDTAADTLLVFDGARLQLFLPDGRLLHSRFGGADEDNRLNAGTARIAYDRNGIISSVGGYELATPAESGTRWEPVRSGEGDAERLLELRLAPLPRGGNGVPFSGPEQARPLWDVGAGCLVAMDGTGALLVRRSLEGKALDTLRLAVPELKRPKVDREALNRLLHTTRGGRYVGPSALRRIEAMTVDPDGYAWLLPVQDTAGSGGRYVVFRVSLANGALERDVVPAFPAAFGEPGVFYARSNGRMTAEAVVTRFERRP
jgi:hypothetical protein